MTERAATRPRRRPRPAAVIWSSLLLFALLFALLTYRLAAEAAPPPRPEVVRKVIEKRVVTTVHPTPGEDSVSEAPAVSEPTPEGPEPVEPVEPVVTSAS
jgi:hypothetical protein